MIMVTDPPRNLKGYRKNKHARKTYHSSTSGLLIAPSGNRIPFQILHDSKKHCRKKGIAHRTMAKSAAELIRSFSWLQCYFSAIGVR